MRTKTLSALLAAATVVAASSGFAQEQPTPETVTAVPAPAAPASTAVRPSRGSTMENVREKFGAPTQEAPSVGTPPITRWEYPGYVVFFENDKVLHTVLMREASAS